MTRTMKNVQGSRLRSGIPGRICRRGNTGVKRGVLWKGFGGEHSRQREEQGKVPDSCLRKRKQANCGGKWVLES